MRNEINKYTYRIEWSEEDDCHIARCLEFPSLSAHGKTAEDALQEIKFVVKESILWLKKDRETIPEPLGLKKFRGHIALRIPPAKHRELVIQSSEEGVSLNQLISSKL